MASIPPKGGRKHPQQDFVKVNTNNILFVCGGTFNGLDKIIRGRIASKTMGFEADLQSRRENDLDEITAMVQPEDLIRFGLIPEFIGRIPIVTTLNHLSLEALVRILTEPKNALVKQYGKLFELEEVGLKFTDEALEAVARDAIVRKSWRGMPLYANQGLGDCGPSWRPSCWISCMISPLWMASGSVSSEKKSLRREIPLSSFMKIRRG